MPLTIRVLGGGLPIAGVRVSRQAGRVWEYVGRTDPEGFARWRVDPSILPLRLLFEAPSGFWPRNVSFREAEGEATVELTPLPRRGPTGWWHACLGPSAGTRVAGDGIRVGILDTGVGPNPCLEHVVHAGAWFDGQYASGQEATRDVAWHGTQVAGLVAARGREPDDYVGIAPGVTAIAGRVFSPDSGSMGSDDVANAIEALIGEHDVHLINLSLGGADRSDVEEEAIADALDRGVLVFSASGNHGGSVWYPAAYRDVVAVSALGKRDEGSELARSGTYVAENEPFDDSSGLYAADFSGHGEEVGCAAPGVEVITTVPCLESVTEFAPMTGTSAASPVACAALAIRLAADSAHGKMQPVRERAEYALEVLRASCRDLGFSRERQGAGLPTVP